MVLHETVTCVAGQCKNLYIKFHFSLLVFYSLHSIQYFYLNNTGLSLFVSIPYFINTH